ncbi:MAG: PspA/IM30 family protein [Chroococcales cyanobacterium]
MGLLDRIWRVIRANVNSLIHQTEDPEKILEQAVADMQQDLIQMRQAVAQAIATYKRTERQACQAESLAQEWYNRAELALSKGDEGLAREALTRRKSYLDTANPLKAQLEQQSEIVQRLKNDMRTLEAKISEAKHKKDMYIARARSAEASQRMQNLMGGLNTGTSLNAFERMEDKVMELEARSQVAAELGGDDLEKRFAALEDGNDVEAQLAGLKANSQRLASSSSNGEVDDELAKLRSQMDQT